MQFAFDETNDDGSGSVTITAENPEEVKHVLDHFRVFDKHDVDDLLAYAHTLSQGTYTHTSAPTKRPWYVVEACLDVEFTQPYIDLLSRRCGYDPSRHGPLPSVDLTQYHPRRLCHTHITDRIGLDHGHICYSGYIMSQEWNNRPALDRAWDTMEDYVAEDVGTRPLESEYIHNRNGTFSRNPNYLKRHRAKPAASAQWLYSWLFNWFMENHASAEQQRIISAVRELNARFQHSGGPDELGSYDLRYVDPNGTCDYDGKGTMTGYMSWSDFAKLA